MIPLLHMMGRLNKLAASEACDVTWPAGSSKQPTARRWLFRLSCRTDNGLKARSVAFPKCEGQGAECPDDSAQNSA